MKGPTDALAISQRENWYGDTGAKEACVAVSGMNFPVCEDGHYEHTKT